MQKRIAYLICYIALGLSLTRAVIIGYGYITAETLRIPASLELLAWVLLVALAGLRMRREASGGAFWQTWGKNWPVLVFIGWGVVSVGWTASLPATTYHAVVLVSSSFVAAYLGLELGLKGLLRALFWFGAVLMLLSLVMAIAYPAVGRALGEPYFGAWRGIFWNRNQLGNLLSLFSAVYLLLFVQDLRERSGRAVVDGVLLGLCLGLIWLTHSATAILVTAILFGASLCAALWLRFEKKLTSRHYIWLAMAGALISVVMLLNIRGIFGLLGRDTSLTGRIPMWQYLYTHVISLQPLRGYGLGALWNLESFRIGIMKGVGWGFQVVIADNGFLDILLGLGFVGLAMFLVSYGLMWTRAVKHALVARSLLNFFPALLMLFTLVANLSFSLFFEREYFVWTLMVAVLAVTTTAKALEREGHLN